MFTIRKAILWMILICSSALAFADDLVITRDGKIRAPVSDYNKNGFRQWWNLTDQCYETEYCSKKDVNYNARAADTGVRSNGKVPATLRTKSSKKTVFKNLLSRAKSGGLLKKAGLFGWAITAYDLVNPWLVDGGWLWDPDEETWVRAIPDDTLTIVRYNSDHLPPNSSGVFTKEKLNAACQKSNIACEIVGAAPRSKVVEKLYQDYCPRINDNYANNLSTGGFCCYGNICKSPPRFFIVDLRDTEQIGQEEFDRIIQPHADLNPSPYVNATRLGQNEPVPGLSDPTVTVDDGVIAQTSPYTNPVTGQPEQTKWTFNTTNNTVTGPVTTVTTTVIPRPDLKPESPEAPVPEPAPEEKPKVEPKPGEGGNPQPEQPKSDLCKDNPDIIACQRLGEPQDGMFDDIVIPSITDDRTWSPDNFLPPNGVCPQPKTFSVVGKSYEVSYQPLCSIMEQSRFIILIAFILMSAYIVFGGLRSSN